LFGYTAQEVVGKPITILMPPERHDEEVGILERLRRGERVDQYETGYSALSGPENQSKRVLCLLRLNYRCVG
jgi:PAS domain S-box-containing protein